MQDIAILIIILIILFGVRRYEISRLRMKAELGTLQADLRLAARIQRNLLTTRPPRIDGYDLAVCNLPNRQVGGDYTDFVVIDDGRLAVCLGDVAGKGLAASLLMANFQAVVRSQAILDLEPGDSARATNRALFRSTDDETFATLFYAILDHRRHTLLYCNAGHEEPILAGRGGNIARLDGGGPLLGVMEDVAYETRQRALEPGDVLLLYSDGVTDSEDGQGAPFGAERLQQVVQDSAHRPASEVIDGVLAAVRHHAAGTPLPDDLSLVVIKRLG